MQPRGEEPGPSWRHSVEETPPDVEDVMIGERIPEKKGLNIERVIIDDSFDDDDDDREEMLVIDEDAEEEQEVQINAPKEVLKPPNEFLKPKNKDLQQPKKKKPLEPNENRHPSTSFSSKADDTWNTPGEPPGNPPMRWGVAVNPRWCHLYTSRPIAPPPPGAEPGEYLTEGQTVINPPQTRRNSEWRRVLHKAFTDPKTFGLRQVWSTANRRSRNLGTIRMKRSAGTMAAAIDLRVATCRDISSLHVKNLEEAEIEPDWDSFWLSAETTDSSFEQTTPGKVTKPVEGSTASESASTPSPTPPSPEHEEEEYVDIMSTSFETPKKIIGPEDIEDEEEIEVDVVSIDDEDENPLLSIFPIQKPEVPVVVEKEPEIVKARSLSSDSFVSPRRPSVRSAILISVEDAPPPPPTRGRPRKRSNQSNSLGSRSIPAIASSSVETPGKRRYRRKNAPQEPQPTLGQAEEAPKAPQPIVKAPRGRKRKTVDVPILPMPEKEPRPLKSRRKTSTSTSADGLLNLQSHQTTTSVPSGSKCKLTIKFGPDLSIPVQLAVKEKVAPGERVEASEVKSLASEAQAASEVKFLASEVQTAWEVAPAQQIVSGSVIPHYTTPARIQKQEAARRAREAKKAAKQASEVSEAIRSPSKLLEFMEAVAKEMKMTTPQLDQPAIPVNTLSVFKNTEVKGESKILKTPVELFKPSEASQGHLKTATSTMLPAQAQVAPSSQHKTSDETSVRINPTKLLKPLSMDQLKPQLLRTPMELLKPSELNTSEYLPKTIMPTILLAQPSIPQPKPSGDHLVLKTPTKLLKPTEEGKPKPHLQKTSAKLMEPPRPEKATPVASSHVLGSEATVMQLLEELNYPGPPGASEDLEAAPKDVMPVKAKRGKGKHQEELPVEAPVDVPKPVKEKRGRKKHQEVLQKAAEAPTSVEQVLQKPAEASAPAVEAFAQPTVSMRMKATSQSPAKGRRRMMHPEPAEEDASERMMVSPMKAEQPHEVQLSLEMKLRLSRLQELATVAASVLPVPQSEQKLQKTPRKSRKLQETSHAEPEIKEPRRTRQGRTPAKKVEEAQPVVTPVKERISRQKRHQEPMEVDPQTSEAVEEGVKTHGEQLNQLERLVKEMVGEEAKKSRKNVEEPIVQKMETASSQDLQDANRQVTFEEAPIITRGRRGKKEHIQPRSSSRAKKNEKRHESPVPLEILRQISLMEKGQEMADDNVSTFSEDVGYQEPGFSAPPVQYQFSPGRRSRPAPPPPVIDLEMDNDVTILSPPSQEDDDDEIQFLSQTGGGILTGPVKLEEDDEEDEPLLMLTDLEYDEDGVDDPPMGGALIDACDYLQLDADNEICEDFLPFPPDKVRIDPSVFFQYIKCLSMGIYNIYLPRASNSLTSYYSEDFSNFLKDLEANPLAEIQANETDPEALVSEAFCNMSLQATQLLTHDPQNKRKLVTSIKFKEMIKMCLAMNNQLKKLAFPLFDKEEENLAKELKNWWNNLERNILLRLCDSLLSLVKETNSWKTPATDNVFRRRFEAVLIGWRSFFLRGGQLKFFFNTVLPDIEAPSIRITLDNWIARLDTILNKIKLSMDLTPEGRTTALMAEIEEQDKEKRSMKWQQCREDVGTQETELHRFRCKPCKIYFTKQDLLKAHAQVHNYKPHMCDICYLDFTYKNSLYIHYLQRHFEEVLLGEITTA